METESLLDWARPRPKSRAVICDIDDTICVQFDQPIQIACQTLTALDRAIHVHYITARPETSREGTERFILDHRLPGCRNLHFCPSHQSSRLHKAEAMVRLMKEHLVLVSIGDHDEDEHASLSVGIPFVRIRDDNHVEAWAEFVRLVSQSANP